MDIKDAFLMAWQPKDEASGITYKNAKYRLIRCLPGQSCSVESRIEEKQIRRNQLTWHKGLWSQVEVH